MAGKETPEQHLKRKADEPPGPMKKRTKKSSSFLPNGDKVPRPSRAARAAQDQDHHILLLENRILESKKNYNDIVKLVGLARAQLVGDGAATAAVASTRVFIRLLAAGSLQLRKGSTDKELIVVHWLRERLGEAKGVLLETLRRGGDNGSAAATALMLAMRLLKAEGEFLHAKGDHDKGDHEKSDYAFPRQFLKQIVAAVLGGGGGDGAARTAFARDFADKYCDVQYYALLSVKDILSSHAQPSDASLFDPTLSFLSAITPPSDRSAGPQYLLAPPTKKSHPLLSPTQRRKAVQDGWLALLALGPSASQRKTVLRILVPAVAPAFSRPELLADFLTDSYDTGGATSLLALSGVYHLMRERNLDYPSFFPKLYSLLDRDLLHSKHRARFFRLLDEFLASTHLPAALVASFIKRLARLSLNAPPAAVVLVVPWIYNLFCRHPLCTFMMHREPRGEEERERTEREGWADTFDEEEPDPMLTGAIDSCIWEVVQLQGHWHPNVATVAKIISEQFTKAQYNMEDFLDHSYASFLETEMGKPIRKPPVVEFKIPKRIYLRQEEGGGEEDGLLARLWEFQ